MEIRAGLFQRAEAGLLLVPRMLQSIEVLQLAGAELLELIQAEFDANETLELSGTAGDDAPAPASRSQFDDWDSAPRRRRAADELDFDPMAEVAASSEQLLDHVREQLAWIEASTAVRDAVLELVAHLDERGFLTEPDTLLAEFVPGGLLEEAVEILRSLDPPGLGARDPVDALLLQVPPTDPDYFAIRRLLTVHLEDAAHNRLPEIARQMGCTVEAVQDLIDRVRGLDPRPGARFHESPAARVQPDVTVEIRDGEIEVRVDETDLPSLGINEDYAAMVAGNGVDRDVKQYLRPKLASARDLIQAVEQRQRTLARVAAAVMHYQRAFLERGVSAIAPLKMSEIADQLGLHTSTVSRAVAGKYVQTDRGIFALRAFFDGARSPRSDQGNGEATGRLGVQQHLRELVDSEPPERPHSDDDLVGLLADRGVSVARRTVAKYRKELGIPSSWRRRRYTTGELDR